jgi:hypothetical protein
MVGIRLRFARTVLPASGQLRHATLRVSNGTYAHRLDSEKPRPRSGNCLTTLILKRLTVSRHSLRTMRPNQTHREPQRPLGPRIALGEPLGMKPAAGLVKLAARRPARECLLGDRPLLPARHSLRVPCCSLPRSLSTSRRAYTIPGIARQ